MYTLQVCFSGAVSVQIMDEKHQFVAHRSGGELLTDCKALHISENQACYNSSQTILILLSVRTW